MATATNAKTGEFIPAIAPIVILQAQSDCLEFAYMTLSLLQQISGCAEEKHISSERGFVLIEHGVFIADSHPNKSVAGRGANVLAYDGVGMVKLQPWDARDCAVWAKGTETFIARDDDRGWASNNRYYHRLWELAYGWDERVAAVAARRMAAIRYEKIMQRRAVQARGPKDHRCTELAIWKGGQA